jgi:hypothetical protein
MFFIFGSLMDFRFILLKLELSSEPILKCALVLYLSYSIDLYYDNVLTKSNDYIILECFFNINYNNKNERVFVDIAQK